MLEARLHGGVREHESAGQSIRRVVVSGGIAKSELMGEILASVLNRPIERLQSSEGPALGAAAAGVDEEDVKRVREDSCSVDLSSSIIRFVNNRRNFHIRIGREELKNIAS